MKHYIRRAFSALFQYNTLIGDMGSSPSCGQRQRVILARAFYKQPKILLLNEATSHIDVTQEKAINDVLKQLGMTIVMIAHWLWRIIMRESTRNEVQAVTGGTTTTCTKA
jgi:ABC-type bacteriocin/lantibiotic exporter with double-glycine peptidase domain